MNEPTILNGDSLNVLKTIKDETVDAVITDPPYGYSFMGKDWDKAVPSVDIWRECLRVLKPGGWCMVMSAPRSDVQNAMISRLMEAGFRLDFTPIYWTYASGFPKAGNVGKLVDKRLGAEREVLAFKDNKGRVKADGWGMSQSEGDPITKPSTNAAKAVDGSYTGFQPKPAVEVVIVAMKPLSEKTYVDQALSNGKGITWLDDARIPTADTVTNHSRSAEAAISKGKYGDSRAQATHQTEGQKLGRFPANLLVSDDVLNDGVKRHKPGNVRESNIGDYDASSYKAGVGHRNPNYYASDNGTSYSRFFDLDAWWAKTFPFLIVPKASKSEKNAGLAHLDNLTYVDETRKDKSAIGANNPRNRSGTPKRGNIHPTVKPLKLMSYLITLTTREGDTVLDPFVGSGTTVVAAKQLGRIGIGIEREQEYAIIAASRVAHAKKAESEVEQTSLLDLPVHEDAGAIEVPDLAVDLDARELA